MRVHSGVGECNQVRLQSGGGESGESGEGGFNQVQLKCAHSAMHFTAFEPQPPLPTSLQFDQFYLFKEILLTWFLAFFTGRERSEIIFSHITFNKSNLTCKYILALALLIFFTYWNLICVNLIVILNLISASIVLFAIFDCGKGFSSQVIVSWVRTEQDCHVLGHLARAPQLALHTLQLVSISSPFSLLTFALFSEPC